MELWIWVVAAVASLLIFGLALLWLGSRAIISAKKLKPFADELARIQKSIDQYPEAVEFYSNLTRSSDKPKNKP
jgi:hypothetical protein